MLSQYIYHKSPLNNFSFLVTGGAGFIGGNLVNYLLKHGAGKVRIVDNFSSGLRDNILEFFDHPAFELIEGDITDFNTCAIACKGITHVSHQAALGSIANSIINPLESHNVNVVGFLNLLTASYSMSVKRFVYASSSSVYGDSIILPQKETNIGQPLSPYAVTKLSNELYGKLFNKIYNIETIGLRYFNVFGPGQNYNNPYSAVIPKFIRSALKNEQPEIFGSGEQTRDFTFVENVVQANVKAMLIDNPKAVSKIYNIGFGQSTSILKLWDYIKILSQVNSDPIFRPEKLGEIKNSLADTKLSAKLLNYLPYISLDDGLSTTFEWYRKAIQL